jgi:NAD(P) transhydrogenase subunit beta
MSIDPSVIRAVYLIAAVAFVLGLKGLSSPRSAPAGNRIAAAGMLLAIAATFFDPAVAQLGIVLPGILVGAAVGVAGARVVKMTAMPQMVALFNGAGGGAAALVSALELLADPSAVDAGHAVSIGLGALIGAISFSGSVIAFGKLQGLVYARAFRYRAQGLVNAVLVAGTLLSFVALVFGLTDRAPALAALALFSLASGVAFVLPIGGADMPVVISLLNAYTGLAVAAAGFVLGNQLLVVSGTLVGASGTILSRLMSKAMNRSLPSILFGAFGAAPAAGAPGSALASADGANVRTTTAEDVAALLAYARKVIVVPGYGLAVAQAQHEVRELADLLESRGAEVIYAIHPVAGRMPGHMNVLLAEANVPYEKLKDMEEVNPEFPRADVALVIGANDVTNPAARTTQGSPIYGMPILDVDKAANIVVIKRSMRPGFAGIDNDLYLDPKCALLFGDAKAVVARLQQEVKAA